MKLELEFTITETSGDTIEGTFNGHDYILSDEVRAESACMVG